MTVKVQCECGQRYAFDVEPVGGVLPSAVACPACGTDGTAAANQFISEQLAARASPPPAAAPIRIAAPAPATLRVTAPASPALSAPAGAQASLRVAAASAPQENAPATPDYRQVDKTRAENEARAKILWGDDPKDVAGFLRSQGLPFNEANDMVHALLIERAKTVRAEGFKKMIWGAAVIVVPIAFCLADLGAGRVPIRLLALTVMVGFYGLWVFVKGLLMFFAPKSESGDVYED